MTAMVLCDGILGQMMEPVDISPKTPMELPEKSWALTGTEQKRTLSQRQGESRHISRSTPRLHRSPSIHLPNTVSRVLFSASKPALKCFFLINPQSKALLLSSYQAGFFISGL
jgi:hypothetical protein